MNENSNEEDIVAVAEEDKQHSNDNVAFQPRQTFQSMNFSNSWFHGLASLRDLATQHAPTKSSPCFNNNVLLIKIEAIDKEVDQICIDPLIRIHICNEATGKYISSITKGKSPTMYNGMKVYDAPLAATNPASHESSASIDPMRRLQGDTSSAFFWNEAIFMKEEYERIIHPNTIILFEVLDCGTMNLQSTEDEKEMPCILWGYLKPLGRNGSINIGTRTERSTSECESKEEGEDATKQCRLQLFKCQKDTWFVRRQASRLGLTSPLVPKVFLQYLRQKRMAYDASLYIRVGPESSPLQKPSKVSACKSRELEEEKEHQDDEAESSDADNTSIDLIERFTRLPQEECIIPDTLLFRFNHNGVATLSFSHSGDMLAVASTSHQVHIYELHKGEPIYTSSHRHHGDILDIAWSLDDSIISCASVDSSISIHLLNEATKRESDSHCFDTMFVEPPAYPTSLIFCPSSPRVPLIVAGLSDGSVSLWNLTAPSQSGELLAGVQCHTAAVNAITSDYSTGRIYTGDCEGKIIIWKPRSENAYRGVDFEVLLQLDGLREIGGKSITNLSLSPGICATKKNHRDGVSSLNRSKQLLITIQSNRNSLFKYDLTSHEFSSFCIDTETKESAFTVANFSPDGRYVAGGTQDGRVILMDTAGIHKKVRSVNANCHTGRYQI